MSLWILSLFVLSQAFCVFAYCLSLVKLSASSRIVLFLVLSQAVCIFDCYPCLSELVGSLSVLSNCLYLAKLPVSLITVFLSSYIPGQVIWTVQFDSVYSTLSHLDR